MSDDAQEMMLYIHRSALGAFQHLQTLLERMDDPELTTQEFYKLNAAQIQAMPDAEIITAVLLEDRNCTVATRIADGRRIVPYLINVVARKERELHHE